MNNLKKEILPALVGSALSLAERLIKYVNGINQTQIPKKAAMSMNGR